MQSLSRPSNSMNPSCSPWVPESLDNNIYHIYEPRNPELALGSNTVQLGLYQWEIVEYAVIALGQP